MQYYFSTLIHNGYNFITGGATIIIKNGIIVDVLPNVQLPQAQVIDGLVCPGFVNAHCHTELSYLHNYIPKHTGLVGFLQAVNNVYIHNTFTQEQMATAIQAADATMYSNGIAAVGDICNTPNSITTKQSSNIQYHNFLEVYGSAAAVTNTKWEQIVDVQKQFNAAKLNNTIVPHAPYSTHINLLSKIKQLQQLVISIHNQECLAEDELIKNGTGDFLKFLPAFANTTITPTVYNKSSLQHIANYVNATTPILLVHNTFTSIADILFAQQYYHKPYWVLCPCANVYIENTLPQNITTLIQNNAIICLGTDSLASNNSLSIWQEIITLYNHNNNLQLHTLLNWATANGAAALQLKNYGVIEKDAVAKLIYIPQIKTEQDLPNSIYPIWL